MRPICTLFAIATLSIPSLVAQHWDNLNQLTSGSEIRVTLTSGTTLHGFVRKVTPDSISINAATSQEILARQDIRRVAQRKPGHRGRNTLIGLGVGTGLGLATGIGIDARSGNGGILPNAGKVVFSPIGAIIGTVIGVAWPTGGWHDLYRAL